MSSAKKIVLLVGAAAAAAALYYGLNWWEAHRSVPPTVAWGTVDMRTVDLMFETSGRIASLAKEEGERVKKGEPLGELDLRALKIERERTAAQLEGLDADWKLRLKAIAPRRLMRLCAAEAAYSAKLAQTTPARAKLYRTMWCSTRRSMARSTADNLTGYRRSAADLAAHCGPAL
ncbi:MAG: biotin/lipoyl-binding protein [Sutterella wadsworthensis]